MIKFFATHYETTRYCKKGLRGWLIPSNNTFRLQFLTLCSSYPLASLKFYRYVEASSPSLGDKISLMLRQRQHTVPTSAYSTIIEILQLLQTEVTIGSWNQLPHESPRWSNLGKFIKNKYELMCKDLNPIGERSSHLDRYGFTSATEATTESNRLNPTSKC